MGGETRDANLIKKSAKVQFVLSNSSALVVTSNIPPTTEALQKLASKDPAQSPDLQKLLMMKFNQNLVHFF